MGGEGKGKREGEGEEGGWRRILDMFENLIYDR
jgi:hypothetical protein